MGLKDIKDFTVDEVGLWLTAQGIDSSKAIEEKVDGDLLLSLTAEDFKSDLGLSGLQSKKIMKNIEFSKVRDVLFMIISYALSYYYYVHMIISYRFIYLYVHILCSYLLYSYLITAHHKSILLNQVVKILQISLVRRWVCGWQAWD